MTWAACALWGLFGGFAVEGLELSASIRRTGRFPWKQRGGPGLAPFLVSVLIRLAVGAGLAVAVGAAGQINPLGALAAGVAAPLIIEKLAQQIPVQASVNPAGLHAASDRRTAAPPSRSDRIPRSAHQPAGDSPGAVDAS